MSPWGGVSPWGFPSLNATPSVAASSQRCLWSSVSDPVQYESLVLGVGGCSYWFWICIRSVVSGCFFDLWVDEGKSLLFGSGFLHLGRCSVPS